MVHQDINAIRRAVKEWVDLGNWIAPIPVTLTLKKCVIIDGRQLWLDKDLARQNLRHCLNRIDRKIYGNRSRRFGAQVRVFSVLEGDGRSKRMHYHLVIDCPHPDWSEDFPNLIMEQWLTTTWGYREAQIDPVADNGWINYITKLDEGSDWDEKIDWMNCRDVFYC